eukprot:jgi/Mesvir1/1438/Mv14431-RA.2
MKVKVEGLTVYFPYEYMYPEQYRYMVELKRTIDAKGHALLEMPTGTGKTITVLSLVTSYQLAHPETGKLIYCTRTVPEMEKVLAELRQLQAYIEKQAGKQAQILALGLSSRKNMCIHPRVSAEGSRESVDAQCRTMTAPWVRAAAGEDNPDIETCSFYEEYDKKSGEALLPPGIYTLHDLRVMGRQKGWCPYFLARHMIAYANVIVYNYQYLLDPKVAGMVSKDLERESIVVFDEAHNIDNVCIEALSVNIRQQTLDGATRNLSRLSTHIERSKATDAERLKQEYNRLVQGLINQGNLPQGGVVERDWLSNPVLPDDIVKEAVPGNIRRAEHFVALLRRLVEYLKTRLQAKVVQIETPITFLQSLNDTAGIDAKTLRFCYDRLQSLMLTLEITDTDEFLFIKLVCDFAALVGTYMKGFAIIYEPYDERLPHVPDPVLQLSCLDASIAIKPVLDRFQTVVITSGTLSPIELYPRLLNFHPVSQQSLPMTLTRDCICPMVVARGSDQLPVSTKFDMRNDPGVVRNYGRLLVGMAEVVPDGIVCFFVSYAYMDAIICAWNAIGVLDELMQHKLVFIETQDVVETSLALDNYRRACDCGRGAVFFSIARILRSRLEYLRDNFQIKENDFLAFDALRQAAQCMGRVIRSKADYGLMVLADKRYNRHDKRNKLPGWIISNLKDAHLNLSTDMALHSAKEVLSRLS